MHPVCCLKLHAVFAISALFYCSFHAQFLLIIAMNYFIPIQRSLATAETYYSGIPDDAWLVQAIQYY